MDVVYDGVGKDTFLGSLAALRPRGMLVLFGQSSGPVPPQDPQILNRMGSLFLTRPTLHHYTASRKELLFRAGEVFRGVLEGWLKVRIGAEFPLERPGRPTRPSRAGGPRARSSSCPRPG